MLNCEIESGRGDGDEGGVLGDEFIFFELIEGESMRVCHILFMAS